MKNKKDIVFNLDIWFIILCLSFLATLVSIILDFFGIIFMLVTISISITCFYNLAFYHILTRHEQKEKYFLRILDSMECEDMESIYELSFYLYNRACDDIKFYKNKIDKLKQKLEVSKRVIRILRYEHLMDKLDSIILQRNIYNAALNYFNFKRYGVEYPKWPKVEG